MTTPHETVQLSKFALRASMLSLLAAATASERAVASAAVAEHIIASPHFAASNAVMVYVALASEPETSAIAKAALRCGKQLYIPGFAAASTQMWAVRCQTWPAPRDGWTVTRGISTPGPACTPTPLPEKTLIVVPGIAFDFAGNRLGRGMGFYDKFLKQVPRACAFVGAAFEFQYLPVGRVPTQAHDVAMHAVATPAGFHAVLAL